MGLQSCDQRCLLGPFVFSSWDLMAWILLKIFFWWPIMVMPRLRTSLEIKDTIRHLDVSWTSERHCSSLCVELRDQPRTLQPGSSLLAHQHKAAAAAAEGPWASSQGQRGCWSPRHVFLAEPL